MARMYEEVLAQVPLFHDLTKNELQALAANCRERDYPAGAKLLQQGETGVGLFIITSGRVRVVQQTPSGDEREFDGGRAASVAAEPAQYISDRDGCSSG